MRLFLTAGLACLFLALTGAPAASAANICWDALAPSSSGDWSTDANWSGGIAPGDGDTAVLDTTSATCSAPANVKVSADTSVGLIRQGPGTTVLVDGGGMNRGLRLTGVASRVQVLRDVKVFDSGYVDIAPGAAVYAGGTVTLGNPGNGDLHIGGALQTITAQFDIVEPAGGGAVSIASGASLTYGPGASGVLNSRLDNDGVVSLCSGPPDDPCGQAQGASGANVQISTPDGQAASTGIFSVAANSKLTFSPTKGTAMPIAAGGILAGAGTVEVGGSVGPPGEPGTVALAANATLDVGTLVIGPSSALQLATAGSATADELVMATGDGGRSGGGTLTATTAQIHGGHFFSGLTKITGQAAINGTATTPVIHDGATLQSEGPTAWAAGNVTLGGAGSPGDAATWQNAGTLTVGGTPSLLSGSDNGVLRNLSGGALIRDSPGATYASVRIENAGTITLLAGSIGTASPLPADAADLVQTGGVTTVAAGAALGMDVTLAGGTLSGAGTVRTLANSAGTVAPGSSTATLSVDGDFSQTSSGTLAIEIAGPGVGQFDRLLVGELAGLGGTLALASAPGYVPSKHATFRIIQAKARSGGFTQLTGAQAAGSLYTSDNLTDGTQLCFACGPPGTVELTVALSGAGTGTVTSDPAGIDCGEDCAQNLTVGTNVTLTAHPAAGSIFVGWSGTCDGLGPCAVAVDQSREVTATFAPEPPSQPPLSAGVAATQVTPAAAPPAQPQVADIVAFPSTKTCRPSRTLHLRVRPPPGLRATRARVTIGGSAARTVRRAELAQPLTLRLPRGRPVKVLIAVTLSDGRVVRESRVYRVCVTSRR